MLFGGMHGGADRGSARAARWMRAGARGRSHRHRIPLGLAMLEQGWITQEQLRAALRAQTRGRAQASWAAGWCASAARREEQVTRALGLQWGCPVLGMDSITRRA